MKKIMLSVCLMLTAAIVSACAATGAKDQALTGDVAHERHATGIDSQTNDY